MQRRRRGVRTPSRRAPGWSLVRSSLYRDHCSRLSPRWRRIADRTWCRRRTPVALLGRSWRGSRRFRGNCISAPPTVRSLGIVQLGGSTCSKVSGCTTRTKCWLPCVVRAFPAGSEEGLFRGRSRVRQLSCTPPPRSAGDHAATFGGTAHQKGFLWGFREVGVALIPLTCVTAPGSPRLSSLSV